MASKRRYHITDCANRGCDTRVFTPHDKRQRFCTPHCRSNYHNDKRGKKEKGLKSWMSSLDLADKKIEVCYLHLDCKENPIDSGWLSIFHIDLSIANVEQSQKSGKGVYWFKRYGLQPINKKETLFKILCRNHI